MAKRRRRVGDQIKDLRTHPKPYVGVIALSEYAGLSDDTVRRDIKKGALPTAKRTGGKILIRTEDAKRYLGEK